MSNKDLNEQLDKWFGNQKTILRGLCAAECINTGKSVEQVMTLYDIQCINENLKYSGKQLDPILGVFIVDSYDK